MTTIAAFDLDQTLIYSLNSSGLDNLTDNVMLVEMYDNEPLSYMTRHAHELLATLMKQALVVPVTTRTQQQYERVTLPVTPQYALCGNGGVLLRNGKRDFSWDKWAHDTAAQSAPVTEMYSLLAAVATEAWVKTVKTAENLFVYLVATNRNNIPSRWLETFIIEAETRGWNVSVQGRKVYAVPDGVSKATGLFRLRNSISETTRTPVRLFSAGDSTLDASMLAAADFSIRPAHGELHAQNWTRPNVTVTNTSGIAAGEEITAWMLTQTAV